MKLRWKTLWAPLRQLFLSGLSAEKIALCLACGLTLSVFPVVGATTLLCTLAAAALRLNLPAIQAVNYLASPLQLLLLLPLIRVGEALFGAPPLPISAGELLAVIRDTPGAAIASLWRATLHAIAAWLLLAPPLFAALFFPARAAFRRMRPLAPAATPSRSAEELQ
jgi:uncharacterized protein (DUF2062 family)